jgi:hypothetical protein
MRNFYTCLLLAFLSACSSTDTGRTSSRTRTYSPDEHDVRMAICVDRIRHETGETWFVDESSTFIEELRKKSGVASIRHISLSRYDQLKQRPVDRYTGVTGFQLRISNVEITADSAAASAHWYASPIGASWETVTLRKQNGQWIIGGRKLKAVS